MLEAVFLGELLELVVSGASSSNPLRRSPNTGALDGIVCQLGLLGEDLSFLSGCVFLNTSGFDDGLVLTLGLLYRSLEKA